MISCKRATELISKSMEERLSHSESIALKLHLFLCEFCEQFRRQVELIRKSLNHQGSSNNHTDEIQKEADPQEIQAAKQRLKHKLLSKK